MKDNTHKEVKDITKSWCASLASYELGKALAIYNATVNSEEISPVEMEVFDMKLEALFSMLIAMYNNDDRAS